FCQAEDGIRDFHVTGVQTCALPILGHGRKEVADAIARQASAVGYAHGMMFTTSALEEYCEELASVVPLERPRFYLLSSGSEVVRSEERRVGREFRYRGAQVRL